MKKILMIGTGGTIASQKTEYGLKPGLSSEELISYIPQVKEVCEVDTIQVCSIDSTNVMPEHWRLMSETVEKYYDKYDGFVICHGTDTMAYTAAALSYMIQNSSKPIVITGSQKPIDIEITDAKTNLLDSFIYVSDDDSQGVDIVFDGKVIMGTRAKKVQSKSYNAFSSINFPYPAVIRDMKVIRYFPVLQYQKQVEFYHELHDSVYVLKMIPGMKPDMLSFIFEHYDCIVIESFGVGGIPSSVVEAFYKQMELPQNAHKIVVMTTQVANEGSNMTVYEVGVKVKKDFDMLESYDMTLEATITKLMWLMASATGESKEVLMDRFYQRVNYDIMYQ